MANPNRLHFDQSAISTTRTFLRVSASEESGPEGDHGKKYDATHGERS